MKGIKISGIIFFLFLVLFFGFLVAKETGEASKTPRKYLLYFVGDIMLSRGVNSRMEKFNDYSWPFKKIGDFLSLADITFGNLEGPLSDKGADTGKKYSFRANPRAMEGLLRAGFDVLSIANNHIHDWGNEAKEDTTRRLKKAGISPSGLGLVPIFYLGEASVAFSSYTHPLPEEIILPAADINIVSMHLGIEYQLTSSEEQKMFAHKAIDAGADLVIGHHPHVREEQEIYQNKNIFYSLGNFVFDQSWSEETMQGWIAKVVVQGKDIIFAEPIEIRINSDFQPEIVIF